MGRVKESGKGKEENEAKKGEGLCWEWDVDILWSRYNYVREKVSDTCGVWAL